MIGGSSERSSPPVGIVGTGRIGAAAASTLCAAGFRVLGTDSDRDILQRAAQRTSLEIATIDSVAQECQVILLALPANGAVLDVVQGPDGLVRSGAREGAWILDLSTVSPRVTVENASFCQQSGIHYADTPIIGGSATCGDWTILAGVSDEELALPARTVLDALGRVHPLGRRGAGNRFKLISSAMLPVSVALTCEVLLMAAASDIDIGHLHSVLSESNGVAVNRLFREIMPRALAGDDAGRFALALLEKDARLALDLTDELGVDGSLIATAWTLLSSLRHGLPGTVDYAELLRRAAARQTDERGRAGGMTEGDLDQQEVRT